MIQDKTARLYFYNRAVFTCFIAGTPWMAFLFGGEEEIRTPAPVSRPTPLAGAPLHQLEYFSVYNGELGVTIVTA